MDLTDVQEANLSNYDVYNADEAFFTCTPFSIVPCVSLNGKPIGKGRVERLSQVSYLINQWIRQVDVDFVGQAMRWDIAS
jgi:branched-chain amino acid aminotransferase